MPLFDYAKISIPFISHTSGSKSVQVIKNPKRHRTLVASSMAVDERTGREVNRYFADTATNPSPRTMNKPSGSPSSIMLQPFDGWPSQIIRSCNTKIASQPPVVMSVRSTGARAIYP